MKRDGFSLLELLISSLIALVLLGLIVGALRSASDSTQVIQDQQVLLEDLRNAGNLISDYISLATFVFPPGTTLTLNSSSAYTVHNQQTNDNTWRVGQDPILAAILPPQDQGLSCNGGANPDGCLRFVAFYALRRGWIMAQAPVTERLEPSPANEGGWVLFTYQTTLAQGSLPANANIATTYSGGRGVFLADYLRSASGLNITYLGCQSGANLAVTCPAAGPAALTDQSGASRLMVTLQAQIERAGRSTLMPVSPLSFQINPRNLPL